MHLKATAGRWIILACNIVAIGIVAVLISCAELPMPVDNPQDPVAPPTNGSIGDTETTAELYNNSTTGDWYSEIEFLNDDKTLIGEAKLVAAQDVVAYLSMQQFNIPGQTLIRLNNYFTMSVTVTLSATSPGKYQVELKNMDNPSMETVSFLIDNIGGLGKSLAPGSSAKAGSVDPVIFCGYIGTHLLVLFKGPSYIIGEAEACQASAQEACGSLGIESALLKVSFGLSLGYQGEECLYFCLFHDQGGLGF